MRVCVAMVMLLVAATSGWAQSVTGVVRDTSGAALPGVAVTASPVTGGPAASTTSDASGSYRLPLLPDRAYLVSFVLAGFVERTSRVASPNEGEARIDVTLDITSFAEEVRVAAELGETQDVASRLGLTRRQTPASVDVVTQDVFQARGADTASTALRGVTGVTSSLRPGASAVFSTRGFIENSVGVLFNGVRVQSSTVTMRNYDAFNFERVEVLRGPGSVLHGEGTAAGAVNFVRRAPQGGRFAADGLLETGDAGRFRVGAAATGPVGEKTSYTVSFARNRFGTHVDDTVHEYNHLAGALKSAVGRVSVGVEGDIFFSDVDDPYWGTPLVDNRIDERLVGKNYNRSADNRYQDTVGWGRVTAAAALNRKTAYNGQVYVYRADRDWRVSYGFEFQPATSTVLRRAVETLAYDHRLFGTRHDVAVDLSIAGRPARVVGGVDLSSTDFSSPRSYGARVSVDALSPEALSFEAPPRADDRRADLWQASAFGELRVDLLPTTTLVLGGRAGRIENDIARPASDVAFQQTFSPRDGRVGIVVSPTAALSAYAQYATGSEPIEALLILGPAESGFNLAHSSLWEGGVKATLWNDRADVTAAVYRLAKRDQTTTDPVDSTRTIQVGEQSSRGVELSIVARPTDRWLVEANIAVLDAQYGVFFEGATSRAGNLPPNVPEVVVNVGATWRPHPRLEAGAWLTHVGERTADTTSTVFQPEYTLVDPFVRLALGRRADLTFRVRNVTNERYVEWATRTFGVTNVYFGEPRRAIVSLRVRL
jgi:iron complex outermembrane receptor protein